MFHPENDRSSDPAEWTIVPQPSADTASTDERNSLILYLTTRLWALQAVIQPALSQSALWQWTAWRIAQLLFDPAHDIEGIEGHADGRSMRFTALLAAIRHSLTDTHLQASVASPVASPIAADDPTTASEPGVVDAATEAAQDVAFAVVAAVFDTPGVLPRGEVAIRLSLRLHVLQVPTELLLDPQVLSLVLATVIAQYAAYWASHPLRCTRFLSARAGTTPWLVDVRQFPDSPIY